jgi:hypothetical protein
MSITILVVTIRARNKASNATVLVSHSPVAYGDSEDGKGSIRPSNY